MLKWRAAARTDAGCQRQRNEDNYYVSPDNRVFAVADGMGGAVGGARASKLAMEAVEKQWKASPPPTDSAGIQKWLAETVGQANHAVWSSAEEDSSVRGMGTTVVVAVQSDDNHMQIAHVGDSRAYLVRDGKIKLLTNDHSVVQEMVRAGRLTEEQARINPYKNLITRCLGHEENVQVDHTPVETLTHDWVVLCSDGLPTVLIDEQIGEVARDATDPDKVCEELVKQTLDGGAPDNVTVVVVKFMDDGSDNGSNQ